MMVSCIHLNPLRAARLLGISGSVVILNLIGEHRTVLYL
jgi:hypothetical protein